MVSLEKDPNNSVEQNTLPPEDSCAEVWPILYQIELQQFCPTFFVWNASAFLQPLPQKKPLPTPLGWFSSVD